MTILPQYRRILLLTEGRLGVFTSKTASSLLRYRAGDIVGVIDAHAAGRDLREFIPWAPPLPIVPRVADAAGLNADALFVGVAPVGGGLAPEMYDHVRDALRSGIDLVSGLHEFCADDPELAALAAGAGAEIHDVRRPGRGRCIASRKAVGTRCRRVLTVGSDGNVGKMAASLELARAARHRGLDARFAATGQTGIMIAGHGVALDAVVCDFAAGAVEELVLAMADSDACFVEGQGGIGHPGFSAVTLALLHGSCPHAMILVHRAGRTNYRSDGTVPIPALASLRSAYEQMARLLFPASVVGVALNTHGMTDLEARREADNVEHELRLPAVDIYRDGCARLLDAVLES